MIIARGPNDVLRGNGGKVGRQLHRGATSDNVQIHVCAVLEIRGQGVHTESSDSRKPGHLETGKGDGCQDD